MIKMIVSPFSSIWHHTHDSYFNIQYIPKNEEEIVHLCVETDFVPPLAANSGNEYYNIEELIPIDLFR